MHPNEALVRKRYDALNQHQWDVLADLLTDDVAWQVPGRNPLSGVHVGKTAVLNGLRRLAELTRNSARVDLEDVVTSDRHVVAIEKGSAEREHKVVEARNLTLFEIRDDRICRMSFFPGNQYSIDEFWE